MKIVKEDKIQKWLEKDYQKIRNLIQNTDIFYNFTLLTLFGSSNKYP